jgi:hypothetical protein
MLWISSARFSASVIFSQVFSGPTWRSTSRPASFPARFSLGNPVFQRRVDDSGIADNASSFTTDTQNR